MMPTRCARRVRVRNSLAAWLPWFCLVSFWGAGLRADPPLGAGGTAPFEAGSANAEGPAAANAALDTPADLPAGSARVWTVLGGEYWGSASGEDLDAYLAWLEQVRPDVVHQGVLGPELMSTVLDGGERKAITDLRPRGLTTQGAYHAFWRDALPRFKALGVRVQATFSMTNLWGSREPEEGFYHYYHQHWEQDLLGPRPTDRTEDLLERNVDGEPLTDGQAWGRFRGCVNNPHWRTLLKALVKAGVDAGFDGFMVQYPHARDGCACEHCQAAFRKFLKSRHGADALSDKLGIDEIDAHVFQTTSPVPGRRAAIDLEARAFDALAVKACFDHVFVDYGRSLKRDLVLSLWTHHREFMSPDVLFQDEITGTDFWRVMDERLLLPLDRWGAGEDYLLCSTPAYQSGLQKGLLGDVTMEQRYLAAMAAGRPFIALKYDYFRWRLQIAESLANGGAVFGNWKGEWSGGDDRDDPHLKRSFDFIRRHAGVLQPRDAWADAAIVYPRTSMLAGDATFLDVWRRLNRCLLDEHLTYDVLIDQRLTPAALAAYPVVIVVCDRHLGSAALAMLRDHAGKGGKVVVLGQGEIPGLDDGLTRRRAESALADEPGRLERLGISPASRSTFDLPRTVQVSSHRQCAQGRLVLHVVNYDRDESIRREENPRPTEPFRLTLALPAGERVRRVTLATPETDGVVELDARQDGRRLSIDPVPGVLVYGLIVIEHDPTPRPPQPDAP